MRARGDGQVPASFIRRWKAAFFRTAGNKSTLRASNSVMSIRGGEPVS